MMTYCSYADCTNKYIPCTSITFFLLPKDHRRQIWIENSGNPELNELKSTSKKYFCEKHFNPKYIRRQFTRAILRKDAVPYKYDGRESVGRCMTIVDGSGGSEISKEQNHELSLQQINPIKYQVIKYKIQSIDEGTVEENVDCQEEYSEITDSLEPEMIQLSEINDVEANEFEVLDNNSVIVAPSENVGDVDEDDDCKEAGISDSLAEGFLKDNEESASDYDEDKHFALSLVGYFRRLPLKKKSIAKLKIMQYLTELEFEKASSALD